MNAFSQLDSEFRVNTYTAGLQQSPNIAANPATGGFQVVWQSDGQDGFLWGVFGQDFNATGRRTGAEISIADLTDGDQESPDVAFNEDGSGMWVWQSTMQIALSGDPDGPPIPTRFPGLNYEVRSKLFGFESDSSDVSYMLYEVQRENTQSNSNFNDDLIDISVSSLGGDRFLTAWYSKDEPRFEYNFMVEGVDANTYRTNLSGEELFGISEPFGSTNWGDAAYLRDITDRRFGSLEEYIIVSSQSDAPDASGGKIIFQIFQQDLLDGSFNYDTRLDTDYNGRFDVVGSGATGSASRPHVAVLRDGGFAITWQERDERSSNQADWDFDTYVQVFNADFTPRAGQIVVDAGKGDQTLPEITALNDGGFAITWTDGGGGNDDIYMQRFSARGWRLGEEERVNDQQSGDQNDAAIDTLRNGDVAVTWTSSNGDNSGGAVMANVFDVSSYGANQAQYIIGTDQNERFNVKGNADYVDGGGGKDVILGGAGNDKLLGNTGNDKLWGHGGKDIMDGGAGNDTLKGGDGRDLLKGGKGNDILDGGAGGDRFVFKRGDGSDTINNFNTNQDHIQIGRGASDFSDLTISRSGSDVEVTFANVSITLDGLDMSDVTSDLFIF